MPTFITVTHTTTTIDVLFNDLEHLPDIQAKGATFKRSELIECWHNDEPIEHLKLIMDTGTEWNLNLIGTEDMMPVTSINGTTPTDIEHLHTLIKTLFV